MASAWATLPFPRFAETDDLLMADLLPLTHAIMSMKMKTSQYLPADLTCCQEKHGSKRPAELSG
jgi:hypothetical protein